MKHFLWRLLERALSREWKIVTARMDAECSFLTRNPRFAAPLFVQQLLISGEDHRHGHHPGFDVIAISRAIWRRVTRGRREGASTIEQQIVRVFTGRYERKLRRKLREIGLAALMARKYSKAQLPLVYLSVAYYGWRMNGYRQACRKLGLLPNSLGWEDGARLVARLKYPEPRVASHKRLLQIERRTRHITALYARHIIDGRTYRHLNAPTIRYKAGALGPLPQS